MLGFFAMLSGLSNKIKVLITVISGIAVIAGSIAAIVFIGLNLAEPPQKPNITLNGNVASWESDEKVSEWELRLNGAHSRVDKGITSIDLSDGDVLSIRAIGGGIRADSEWSNVVEYKAAPETAHTVTWKNYDGTVLSVDTNVPRGSVPSYSGDLPTRAQDARCTYSFNGWNPSVSAVESDVTYTAIFSETPNLYTVEFYSDDGAVLLDTVSVAYGAPASYTKSLPEKSDTPSHTYSFEKWVTSPASSEAANIASVTENIKVYACFAKNVKKFTVTFVADSSEYGSVSRQTIENVPYGSGITLNGNALTVNGVTVFANKHDDTVEYTYGFTGWKDVPESVESSITVTADFERSRRTYTVIWRNTNGSVLEIDGNVEYGTIPSYDGAVPNYPEMPEGLYAFNGNWSPSVEAVTGNAEYTAAYERRENLRLVTFYDEDGQSVLGYSLVNAGESALYSGVPSKPSTADKTYTFDKWVTEKGGSTEASLLSITEDKSVYASYETSVRQYTVVFKEKSGELICTKSVNYGEASEALAFAPSKAGYTLSSWNTEPDGSGNSFVDSPNPDWELFSSAVDESVTLYACWKANQYNVVYVGNKPSGASGEISGLPEAELWTYDEDCALAGAPSLVGWSFCGWYRDEACTVKAADANEVLIKPNYTLSGEVSLYAKWIQRTYTVAYDANGGEGTTASSHHTYDVAENLTASGFSRENHVFLGWSKNPGDALPTYTDGESVSDVSEDDVTLYAVWLKIKSEVSYSDEKTILNAAPHTDSISSDMSVEALAYSRYTHLKITVKFNAMRTQLASDNASCADLNVKNNTYTLINGQQFYYNVWCEEFFSKEIELCECNDGGLIEIKWYTSNGSASAEDGWVLGVRSITVEAIKN